MNEQELTLAEHILAAAGMPIVPKLHPPACGCLLHGGAEHPYWKIERYRIDELQNIEIDYTAALVQGLNRLEHRFFLLIFGMTPTEAEKARGAFSWEGLSEDRAKQLEAWFDEWLAEARGAAGTYPTRAYQVGMQNAAGQLGLTTAFFSELDQAAVRGITEQNLALIGRDGPRLVAQIRSHMEEGMRAGLGPGEIARNMRYDSPFVEIRNNLELIARDQVAKAQSIGRDHEFRQNLVSMVRISVAPDACDICLPFSGMVVRINDTWSRPQYHIACRCSEVPEVAFGRSASDFSSNFGPELPETRMVSVADAVATFSLMVPGGATHSFETYSLARGPAAAGEFEFQRDRVVEAGIFPVRPEWALTANDYLPAAARRRVQALRIVNAEGEGGAAWSADPTTGLVELYGSRTAQPGFYEIRRRMEAAGRALRKK